MNLQDKAVYDAVYRAVLLSIQAIGLENFRKSSFFQISSQKLEEIKKAA